jgi:hypothetical protein
VINKHLQVLWSFGSCFKNLKLLSLFLIMLLLLCSTALRALEEQTFATVGGSLGGSSWDAAIPTAAEYLTMLVSCDWLPIGWPPSSAKSRFKGLCLTRASTSFALPYAMPLNVPPPYRPSVGDELLRSFVRAV